MSSKTCSQGCSFRVTKNIKIIDSKKISKESLNALRLILLERCLKGSIMLDLRLNVKNSIH